LIKIIKNPSLNLAKNETNADLILFD